MTHDTVTGDLNLCAAEDAHRQQHLRQRLAGLGVHRAAPLQPLWRRTQVCQRRISGDKLLRRPLQQRQQAVVQAPIHAGHGLSDALNGAGVGQLRVCCAPVKGLTQSHASGTLELSAPCANRVDIVPCMTIPFGKRSKSSHVTHAARMPNSFQHVVSYAGTEAAAALL